MALNDIIDVDKDRGSIISMRVIIARLGEIEEKIEQIKRMQDNTIRDLRGLKKSISEYRAVL